MAPSLRSAENINVLVLLQKIFITWKIMLIVSAWRYFCIWKHSTSKVSPKKCSFLSEMSCAQTLTRFVWGLYIWKNTAEGRGTKHCKQKRPVKNRWSKRTGGEVHADPPAWIFPVQACDSNYITLKQIQIIDTLVAKFRKAPSWSSLWQEICFRAYKGGPNSVSKNHISFRCKKRTQKLASCTFLSWSWQSFPFYYVDASLQSRRFEARRGLGEARRGQARPRHGRKTYWHKDKARLMGTRNYI